MAAEQPDPDPGKEFMDLRAEPRGSYSGFFKALHELGERHEEELQELRAHLEAKISLQAAQLEELHTLVEGNDLTVHGEGITQQHAEEDRTYCRYSGWNRQGSSETYHQSRSRESLSADLAHGESQPVSVRAPEDRTYSGFSKWNRQGSSENQSCSREPASADLMLVKGWSSRSGIKTCYTSKAVYQYHVPFLFALTHHQVFDALCSVMIISNAVIMGIAVNWSAVHYWEAELPKEFTILDRVFTVWFLVELFLRIGGSGFGFIRSKDWCWNLFDLAVVVSDLGTAMVQMTSSSSTSKSGGGTNLSIVRLFRVLRVTRALRIVRLFRFFRELRMMVFSVLRSGTSLVWSVVLFYMDVFLFATYLTQNVTVYLRDNPDSDIKEDLEKFFGTLFGANHTLFMAVSGGISWVEITGPLTEVHWSNTVIFVFFIFFTVYALTNIITGIFVDTAIQSAQSDRDEVIQAQLSDRASTLQQMKELFMDADVDGDGMISFDELNSHLRDERVRAHMASLGLQLDEARGLFRLLDMDKSGHLSIDEFIVGCMRLKGNARSIDLATLMYENKKMFTMMKAFFAFVEEEFSKIYSTIKMMDNRRLLSNSHTLTPQVAVGPGCQRAGSCEEAAVQSAHGEGARGCVSQKAAL